MNITLTDISIFLALLLAGVYWWRSRGQHTVALASARRYCKERGIQLLDETLVFRKFAMTRAANNRRYFSRVYGFDFCIDGTDRHRGEIVLHRYAVIRVMLEGETLEITEY